MGVLLSGCDEDVMAKPKSTKVVRPKKVSDLDKTVSITKSILDILGISLAVISMFKKNAKVEIPSETSDFTFTRIPE